MEQVSIVMPALNEAAGIVPVLERLQRCREAGHELILVDGGSADGTGTLAAPFVDTLVRASPGRALQMNAGAARARGGTLWFLHADTLPCTDAVGQILEARSRNGRWGRFDVVIDSPRPLLGVVAAMMNLRSAFTGIATGDQGIFVERALFESLGGFAPLPLMEDIELSRRLRFQLGEELSPARLEDLSAGCTAARVIELFDELIEIGELESEMICEASAERGLSRMFHSEKEDRTGAGGGAHLCG